MTLFGPVHYCMQGSGLSGPRSAFNDINSPIKPSLAYESPDVLPNPIGCHDQSLCKPAVPGSLGPAEATGDAGWSPHKWG